ncbi:hypothetical protein, conserved [Trypanosoma brucei brucei TREU927]|uniref:Uncharacterized protein n=1 Tax=Trypanosoma brucei brucei (strain 927/4 GUTat10.1) TaxID=185431 RepID=Q387W9_TRYB2|nr:hypothetical protein, conserved [Trypanosoma brucei brucei TREU927]EAN78903.1 hypothetical protein, conserved [Trypanosoma brucei brucei TREU927]
MKNALEQLDRHPLVNFQMDVSPLYSALKNIMQEQIQQAQLQEKISQRLTNLEAEVRSVGVRQKEFEDSLDALTPDAKLQTQQTLKELSTNIKNLTSDMKKVRYDVGEAMRTAVDAKRGIHDLESELLSIRQQQRDFSDLHQEVMREHLKFTAAVKDIRWKIEEQEKLIQEFSQVKPQNTSEVDESKLHGMLSALCERTDQNFRSVEESSFAVDAELTRLRADMKFVQNEVRMLRSELHRGGNHLRRDVGCRRQSPHGGSQGADKSALRNEEHLNGYESASTQGAL